MPRILIIDDVPTNRKLLAKVLQLAGYEVAEATDGEDALKRLPEVKPDLVITDILMPVLDGYEFVRRMRQDPVYADTPTIFYSATYHEREARTLAERCGVVDVLTKPSSSEKIAATVRAALTSRKPCQPSPVTAHADIEYITAGADVAEHLISERDPMQVLKRLCEGARRLTLAQQATTGLFDDEGATSVLFRCGTEQTVPGPCIDSATLNQIKKTRPALAPGEAPVETTSAAELPTTSYLAVPVASSSRVYGWLTLHNKLGADGFTPADEWLATTLASRAGIAYENAQQLIDLRLRSDGLEQDLRRISARARALQEEERTRLARALHDQLGQSLAALKMDASWLERQAPTKTAGMKQDVRHRVGSMLQRIDEALQTVRRISGELRPPVLDHGDLVAAIEWEAEAFERRAGIRCRVQAKVEHVTLGLDRSTSVFRIYQEALTNVFHHAQATRVDVTVDVVDGRLLVAVADNGRGISDADLQDRNSLGLTGMRERATFLEGTVDFRRQQPGTVVTIAVPLDDPPDQTADAVLQLPQ